MKMKFTVYSKTGCPYCVKIKQVLEMAHLDHVVYNLDEQFTREQFYKEFGEGSTFPQVLLDGEQLGGCADTVAYLMNEGYIKN
jgi:glutaredoxin